MHEDQIGRVQINLRDGCVRRLLCSVGLKQCLHALFIPATVGPLSWGMVQPLNDDASELVLLPGETSEGV